jgi:hypothetical protein
MYSMPSNYCPSPIRLMPACPMVPNSPMGGVQTFYITMPSDAAAMFFDPNLAAVQQQHQTMLIQHSAHQSSMPPFRHMQQHHSMMIGNNSTDSSMVHHPYPNGPSAFFMAAATAPSTSPDGGFFQQQMPSPLPFYMRPLSNNTHIPVSAPSPLTVITTSTTTVSNASSPPPSTATNATTQTSSSSNEPSNASDQSSTKRSSPIPCTLLVDDTHLKATRSVTSKAIATLTNKLMDLLRTCKISLNKSMDIFFMTIDFRYMVIACTRRINGDHLCR